MSERKPLMAANWKMHKNRAEAREFVEAFIALEPPLDQVEVVLCPPFTALEAAVSSCEGSGIQVAAQNMHQEQSGAFTGEVSAAMLSDLGVHAVVLGHSERRESFGETDESLSEKVPAALEAGLTPILCVGETEAQRSEGKTHEVLADQVRADLANVSGGDLARIVIAYEPIWAIGTGQTATPEQAQEACGLIRALLAGRSDEGADALRILYGGSMKPENAAELVALEDVDGGLVGGASLDPADFAAITSFAASA
ncbi:MAG: triose-phosphate isomerase [bacterium]